MAPWGQASIPLPVVLALDEEVAVADDAPLPPMPVLDADGTPPVPPLLDAEASTSAPPTPAAAEVVTVLEFVAEHAATTTASETKERTAETLPSLFVRLGGFVPGSTKQGVTVRSLFVVWF